MALSNEDIYKEELRRLKQRVYYRRKQGYNIDIEKLTQGRGQHLETDIEYLKSLRGTTLLSYADYEQEDISDIGNIMNEPTFEEPEERISPDAYTHIGQIEAIIMDFPLTLPVQFDRGELGTEMYGKREEISVEFFGNAIYDIWLETVNRATEENRLQELEDYYADIQDELAEILEPYGNEHSYYYESDLMDDFTQTLRLLNWGEALSMDKMQELSDYYSMTDVSLLQFGDEY